MPIKALAIAHNPPEYLFGAAEQKMEHARKVVSWYDYVQKNLREGRITEVWAGLPFTVADQARGAAVTLYSVESLDDLQSVLQEDPLHEESLVKVLLLTDIVDQFERAVRKLRGFKIVP